MNYHSPPSSGYLDLFRRYTPCSNTFKCVYIVNYIYVYIHAHTLYFFFTFSVLYVFYINIEIDILFLHIVMSFDVVYCVSCTVL